MSTYHTRAFATLAVAASLLLAATAASGQRANLADGLYAEVDTSRGTILLQLEFERAPMTVANFVGLSEGSLNYTGGSGPFYDGLTFHRVVDNFMIQGGDPDGTGRGGPGYQFADEFVPELRHDRPGTLSMANAGANTNGSQFFITHVATTHLDGRHTVFGHVVRGQDVVAAIAQGDRIDRVRILRVGRTAERFRADQAAFESLQRQAVSARQARVQSQIDAAVPNGVATDSGLRYVITKQGRGRRKPSATSTVTVHYVGKLLNGTVFDSSLARNEPGVFPTNRVIPGFSETLQDMRVGEKRTVLIPPELGYGSRGAANGAIPGGAHLIFEIELISFQ